MDDAKGVVVCDPSEPLLPRYNIDTTGIGSRDGRSTQPRLARLYSCLKARPSMSHDSALGTQVPQQSSFFSEKLKDKKRYGNSLLSGLLYTNAYR
jgi:hypothetical protein